MQENRRVISHDAIASGAELHSHPLVEQLAATLMKGEAEPMPERVPVCFIAAAAVTAFTRLCQSGTGPREALAIVENAAQKMLRARIDQGMPDGAGGELTAGKESL